MYDALHDSDRLTPLSGDSATGAPLDAHPADAPVPPAAAHVTDDAEIPDGGRLAATVPRPFSRQTRGAARPQDPSRTPAATCLRGDALSDLTDELFGYYQRR